MEKIDIVRTEPPIRLSANSILSAGDLLRQIAMIVASSFRRFSAPTRGGVSNL
jgi:hypothetical protein